MTMTNSCLQRRNVMFKCVSSHFDFDLLTCFPSDENDAAIYTHSDSYIGCQIRRRKNENDSAKGNKGCFAEIKFLRALTFLYAAGIHADCGTWMTLV